MFRSTASYRILRINTTNSSPPRRHTTSFIRHFFHDFFKELAQCLTGHQVFQLIPVLRFHTFAQEIAEHLCVTSFPVMVILNSNSAPAMNITAKSAVRKRIFFVFSCCVVLSLLSAPYVWWKIFMKKILHCKNPFFHYIGLVWGCQTKWLLLICFLSSLPAKKPRGMAACEQ